VILHEKISKQWDRNDAVN
jgi:hypothetical protein